MRRKAAFVLAAAVVAGLLASEGLARDGFDNSSRHQGAQIAQVRHHGHYDRHRDYRHDYRRYDHGRHHGHYRSPYHHRYYRPVPDCYRPYGTYRYNYHPFNSFYYGNPGFGFGFRF
jgi:hypothetical protein